MVLRINATTAEQSPPDGAFSPAMYGGVGGGVGDGATDATDALQQAFTAALAANGTLYIPPGRWVYSEQIGQITDAMTVEGAGHRVSFLTPASSYTGWAFDVNECWRSGEETPSDTALNPLSSTAGVTFRGFAIYGNRATQANGIKYTGRNDHHLMEHVGFYFLNGTALAVASEGAADFYREGLFTNVRVHGCGNATAAAVEVASGTTLTDSTNHVTFRDCWVTYNLGTAVHLWCENTSTPMRRVVFRDLMLHGLNAEAAAPPADLMLIEGRVQDVTVDNLKANGSHVGYAIARIRQDANAVAPRRVDMRVSLSNSEGDGIVVEDVDTISVRGFANADEVPGDLVRFDAGSVTKAAVVDLLCSGTPTITVDASVSALVDLRSPAA